MSGAFFKYPGGKAKLVKHILPILPPKFGDYHEPFVGAGAVFFALSKFGKIGHAHINDINEFIMPAFEAVRDDVDTVIALLRNHATRDSEKYYLNVRSAVNAALAMDEPAVPKAVHAARFLYMNKVCFNGLVRTNAEGAFNVGYGHSGKLPVFDEAKLREASTHLQHASLHSDDFRSTEARVKEGDLVYFDPPYVPISEGSSFAGYTKSGFSLADHRDLADMAKRLRAKGAHVVASNSDTTFVRNLYPETQFSIYPISVPRTINCNSMKRGRVNELLICSR